MKLEDARSFALSLPEVVEAPHFEMSSFRVRGKIVATVPPDGRHLHVFVGEDDARALAAASPKAYAELWWGKRLTGVRITLRHAKRSEVAELIEESWRRKAPKALVRAFDASS